MHTYLQKMDWSIADCMWRGVRLCVCVHSVDMKPVCLSNFNKTNASTVEPLLTNTSPPPTVIDIDYTQTLNTLAMPH